MTTYQLTITLGDDTWVAKYTHETQEQAAREAEQDHPGATVELA